ncbi:MAG: hypothetical protein ACOYMG_13505 [Candidatus Methylumidiphilus sp.]
MRMLGCQEVGNPFLLQYSTRNEPRDVRGAPEQCLKKKQMHVRFEQTAG